MKGKTILFGGSGFIGPTILEKYPDIISVGRNPPPSYVKNKHIRISEIGDLSALDNVDFDKVIFLIGNSDHHVINVTPTMGLDYNAIPLKKVLFYMQNRNLKKFICFSTILMYDEKKITVPVSENQPINPYSNDYIFSKFVLEEIARFYSKKIPIITVRLTNIYGPTKLIRPDLVTMLIEQILSPNETIVWNENPMRDFLFTYDAADALVKLLDTDYTGIVNVGSGKSTPVSEVVKIIERLSGKQIKNLNKPVWGPMQFVCDISRLKQLTGWQPKYSIEEGLKITYGRMKEWADECKWWEKARKD